MPRHKTAQVDAAEKTDPKARRRRRRPGALTGALVAAGLAVAGIIGLGMLATPGQAEQASLSPDLHLVGTRSFDITVTASGELEAKNQTEIRNKLETSATILEVIEEGTRVKKGDLLIKLNDEELRTKIEDQELQVEAARSDLIAAENSYEIQVSENEADLRQAKLDLELAKLDLKKWKEGELVKERKELELEIETAKRDKDRLEEKLDQSESLYKREFLSKDELEQDRIRYLEAAAALERAQLDKWVYETFEVERQRQVLTSEVEEAQAKLERVKRQNASRLASNEADVTNKQRQLEIREKRLAELRKQLEATEIRALTDGLVVYATSLGDRRRSNDEALEVGKTVNPNELLIVLPETSQMVASVSVHESVAGRIRPGQPANVRINAVPNRTFSGTVREVGVLAESGGWRDPNLREYTVKVELNKGNPNGLLKPSMRCEGEIVLGRVEDALAVPVQAIFHDSGVSFVYQRTDSGRFLPTPIRVGRESSLYAEILAGLEQGAEVLLREPAPGEVIERDLSEFSLAQGKGDGAEGQDWPGRRPGMTPKQRGVKFRSSDQDGERNNTSRGRAKPRGDGGRSDADASTQASDNDGRIAEEKTSTAHADDSESSAGEADATESRR